MLRRPRRSREGARGKRSRARAQPKASQARKTSSRSFVTSSVPGAGWYEMSCASSSAFAHSTTPRPRARSRSRQRFDPIDPASLCVETSKHSRSYACSSRTNEWPRCARRRPLHVRETRSCLFDSTRREHSSNYAMPTASSTHRAFQLKRGRPCERCRLLRLR